MAPHQESWPSIHSGEAKLVSELHALTKHFCGDEAPKEIKEKWEVDDKKLGALQEKLAKGENFTFPADFILNVLANLEEYDHVDALCKVMPLAVKIGLFNTKSPQVGKRVYELIEHRLQCKGNWEDERKHSINVNKNKDNDSIGKGRFRLLPNVSFRQQRIYGML